MRNLSPSLLAAQKATSREPRVKVVATNVSGGVVKLRWERLHDELEQDQPMGMAIAGDGSMVSLFISGEEDNRKLYYQQVLAPGPESDFGIWSYFGHYNVVNCAVCSLGSEVSLFWVKSDGELDCVRSLDNGASWQGLEYLGYAPTGAVSGLAAAYKPNGDLAVFFTDGPTLYIIKRIAGEWQDRVALDKTTGELTGVAAVFDADFKLLVCGKDAAGNCKVWSLVYGEGGEVSQGVWSDLKELASAPSGSNYEFVSVSLDKFPAGSIYRCFYVEKFSGVYPYCRAFTSHTLAGGSYLAGLWIEPVPFDMVEVKGVPLAHDAEYAWLYSSSGVWRAKLAPESHDISESILSLKADLQETDGKLTIELSDDHGQYDPSPYVDSPLFSLDAPSLDIGCQIDFSPGYRTKAGCEFSRGLSFSLEAYENVVSAGKHSLILYAADGWTALENWTARYQFRWNKPDEFDQRTSEASVNEILTQVVARCGLRLENWYPSSQAADFYPDFTIHPGDKGKATVERLLAFIPDVLFIEGSAAYLINPLTGGEGCYAYGPGHVIQEGRYRVGFQKFNRFVSEGVGGIAELFDWAEIEKHGDIIDKVEDANIDTPHKAQELSYARMRKAQVHASCGFIRVPVNCGQQLYDVIAMTPPWFASDTTKRRVLGISLSYLPAKGEYEQRLVLGGV